MISIMHYSRARALTGGWKAWQEAGLPVEPRLQAMGTESMKDLDVSPPGRAHV
jgi:3-mercaptopyruvate sulfurtransferase SseA